MDLLNKNFSKTIVSDEELPSKENNVLNIVWSGEGTERNSLYVESYISERSEDFKIRFLKEVESILDQKTLGIPLDLYFNLGSDGYSAIYNSNLFEKAPFLDPSIYLTFKIYALDDLLKNISSDTLEFKNIEDSVVRVFKKKYPIINKLEVKSKSKISSFRVLLNIGRHLSYIYRNKLLSIFNKAEPLKDAVTIVSYFPVMDLKEANQGIFNSNFFRDVHKIFEDKKTTINWLFYFDPYGPLSYKKAVAYKNLFNKTYENQRFFFIEEFSSWETVYAAAQDYVATFLRFLYLDKSLIKKSFAGEFLLPIFKKSLLSNGGMDRYQRRRQMIDSINSLRSSSGLLFIQESQPWEHALVLAYRRRFRNRPTVGYQHVMCRDLDLRYFFSGRAAKNKYRKVFPEKLALIGEDAFNRSRKYGELDEALVGVEAAKYSFLAGRYWAYYSEENPEKYRILVTLGYQENEVRDQLDVLKKALVLTNDLVSEVLFKFHPYSPYKLTDSEISDEFHNGKVVDGPIENYWGECDLVFCSNSGTVVLEAAWLGKPVIIMDAKGGLNLNPLFDQKWKEYFISDAEGLAAKIKSHPNVLPISKKFLNFDDQFQGWKKLLEAFENSQ